MRLRRAWSGGVVITAGFVVSWGRESLTKTMVNRRILATGFLAFAVQLALRVGPCARDSSQRDRVVARVGHGRSDDGIS